jgi:chemotaxis protein methyltransferase CheR
LIHDNVMLATNAATPDYSVNPLAQVTDVELRLFAELIYERTGIRVCQRKKILLSNRLRRRLRQTGIGRFGQYYKHLRQLAPDDAEWDAFLQEITTHETCLFRDKQQWDWLRDEFMPEWFGERNAGHSQLPRIWSAACSTGDEAVTAACCAAAVAPADLLKNVSIWGTDIGADAIAQANAGVYGRRAMRFVPDDYRRRFFTKIDDAESWRTKPPLRRILVFQRHNLMDPMPGRTFDVVILKNVLIYFDAASKRIVLNHIRAALRVGGYLVSSATENVGEFLREFARLRPWLYRKTRQS